MPTQEKSTRISLNADGRNVNYDFWGPYKIPFIPGAHEKITNTAAYNLVHSSHKRAMRIPQACRKKALFLLDKTAFGTPKDVQSDLNGVFSSCAEIKTKTVLITKESDNFVVRVQEG